MPSSPLTMALLGGGMGSGLQDPAYLPAARRLSLAQSLIGQGTDASSAYPMQALSRLASAALGAHEFTKGESMYGDVTAQRQGDAQRAIQMMNGGGGGLAGAIAGPPPAAPTPAPAPSPAPVQQEAT